VHGGGILAAGRGKLASLARVSPMNSAKSAPSAGISGAAMV